MALGLATQEGHAAKVALHRVERVSITASPSPVIAGQTVIITGEAPGEKSGAPVVLWRRLPGQRRFFPAGRTTITCEAGSPTACRYQFTVRSLLGPREWYASTPGGRSAMVHERVRAGVELNENVAAPEVGDPVTFTGVTSPTRARSVVIQQRSGQRWFALARAHLTKAWNYTVTYRFPAAGTLFLRALVPQTGRSARAISPTLRLGVVALSGIHKIQHVVIIMQENRSFDSYFGTYPGADGIPHGVCEPDPLTGNCVRPYHDSSDLNYGAPHDTVAAEIDTNAGRMDGFLASAVERRGCTTKNGLCTFCTSSSTSPCLAVMGYHDAREIPNYWRYANDFVLQDHMFAQTLSWSLPAHLFMVSGWSALCLDPSNPFSCSSAQQWPASVVQWPTTTAQNRLDTAPLFGWTDITYLLHRAGISWRYYVRRGNEPDCEDDTAVTCAPVKQNAITAGVWNPLPHFTDVHQDGQMSNVQSLTSFFAAASTGTLPAVSWIVPDATVSEHPPSLISSGQTYVTGLVNTIMKSPDWDSTAIFISWDEWGGFYDHVMPPSVDQNGYGLRVPALMISPYARQGYVDHQILSHDAYLKFIEDDFLGGQRLDPRTDGRPDPRPDVRETSPILGDLTSEFDFTQRPRAPILLSVHPAPGPPSTAP